MHVAAARRALERRPRIAPVLGVIAQAAALTGVGVLVLRGLGEDVPPLALALGALGLFAALEIGVQRRRARRDGPLRALFGALIDALGEAAEPTLTWPRGLPCLRAVVDDRHFAIHLESAGERLRVAMTATATPAAHLWLVSRQPEDYPHKLEARLARHLRRLSVDDATLCALSADPEPAEALLARPGVADHLRALLAEDAPAAATVEVSPDAVRWDAALTPRITAPRLLDVARRLPPLVEVEAAEAEGEADDEADGDDALAALSS
ncbi:MAG: hypothetical protein H6706_04965 [Myxococcales bacterium]|nr:hypothetical protein [Myxococcales bacterium]